MKILLLFAHPAQTHSRTNRLMFEAANRIPGITCVYLYGEYPRHDIDVEREQQRLIDHDLVIFQFPLYWYSTPPLLKEWMDLVLEHGFAYGESGTRLRGKSLLCAVTAGGPEAAYQPGGRHGFTLRHLLSPLQATANLCGMRFLSPIVLFGALGNENPARKTHIETYVRLLSEMRDETLDETLFKTGDVVTAAALSPLLERTTP